MNINNKGVWVFLILLLLSSCFNKVDIEIEKEGFFVYGLMDNTSAIITVFDIANKKSPRIKDAQIKLTQEGVSYEMNFNPQENNYHLTDYKLKPGLPYIVEVKIKENNYQYTGTIPDSSMYAKLNLTSIKDGNYRFSLETSGEAEDNIYFHWNGKKGSSGYVRSEEFLNKFKSNFKWRELICNTPVRFNRPIQFRYTKTTQKEKELSLHGWKHYTNSTNPLFIAYESPSDYKVDDAVFRMWESTNFVTNSYIFKDTSKVLFTLNLIDQYGKSVYPSATRYVSAYIFFKDYNNIGRRFDLETSTLEITKSMLLRTVNNRCNEDVKLIDYKNEDIEFLMDTGTDFNIFSNRKTAKLDFNHHSITLKVNL